MLICFLFSCRSELNVDIFCLELSQSTAGRMSLEQGSFLVHWKTDNIKGNCLNLHSELLCRSFVLLKEVSENLHCAGLIETLRETLWFCRFWQVSEDTHCQPTRLLWIVLNTNLPSKENVRLSSHAVSVFVPNFNVSPKDRVFVCSLWFLFTFLATSRAR